MSLFDDDEFQSPGRASAGLSHARVSALRERVAGRYYDEPVVIDAVARSVLRRMNARGMSSFDDDDGAREWRVGVHRPGARGRAGC